MFLRKQSMLRSFICETVTTGRYIVWVTKGVLVTNITAAAACGCYMNNEVTTHP